MSMNLAASLVKLWIMFSHLKNPEPLMEYVNLNDRVEVLTERIYRIKNIDPNVMIVNLFHRGVQLIDSQSFAQQGIDQNDQIDVVICNAGSSVEALRNALLFENNASKVKQKIKRPREDSIDEPISKKRKICFNEKAFTLWCKSAMGLEKQNEDVVSDVIFYEMIGGPDWDNNIREEFAHIDTSSVDHSVNSGVDQEIEEAKMDVALDDDDNATSDFVYWL